MSLVTAIDEAKQSTEKHVLRIMHPKEGDVKVIWDADNPDEVEVARDTFKKMKKKGMVAYNVKKDGGIDTVMDLFDPYAEAIIMAPPLKGG